MSRRSLEVEGSIERRVEQSVDRPIERVAEKVARKMEFQRIVLAGTSRPAGRIFHFLFPSSAVAEKNLSRAERLVNTALPANFPSRDDLRETRYARVFPVAPRVPSFGRSRRPCQIMRAESEKFKKYSKFNYPARRRASVFRNRAGCQCPR